MHDVLIVMGDSEARHACDYFFLYRYGTGGGAAEVTGRGNCGRHGDARRRAGHQGWLRPAAPVSGRSAGSRPPA
jgi:hypothetical protein